MRGERHLVKRLIGLPGDTVTERDGGFVYINGKRLNEPYIKPDRRAHDSTTGSWRVPQGSYFFMGDNPHRATPDAGAPCRART